MYGVLESSDQNWNMLLKGFPKAQQDIYYTSEYYHLCESNGEGIGKLFYFEDELGNKGYYPFLLNKINNDLLNREYYDIETAYGYGGPIIKCKGDFFYDVFESKFIEYCKENGIVAEFIRFHPLVGNETKFKKYLSVCKNRTTVSIDLTQKIDDIWSKDLKSENRTQIRKAKKNGLYIEKSNDYDQFKIIYEHTMKKVNAQKEYLFNDDYYLKLSKIKNAFLINVMMNEQIIASGCFLYYGDYCHYHLGGSLAEYLRLGPNNFMMWEAIKIGKELGCRTFHLGGGLTDEPHDNLFRFKKTFSKDFNSFYIGKRIHNQDIYEKLIKNWEKKNKKKASLFLQYKY